MKIPHDPEEILPVVDNQDKINGKSTRKEIHAKGQLHREVGIFITSSNKILLQKRADNKKWDTSCAGHVGIHQTYLKAAIRELEEELDIRLKEQELHYLGKELLFHTGSKINNRFVTVYHFHTTQEKFNIDKQEILKVQWFTVQDIHNIPDLEITSGCKELLKKYLSLLIS